MAWKDSLESFGKNVEREYCKHVLLWGKSEGKLKSLKVIAQKLH